MNLSLPFVLNTLNALPRVARVLLCATACLTAGTAFAQADAQKKTAQGTAKPATKPATKPAAAKAPRAESASRVEARSTASQMAAGIIAAETALTPEELAIAEQVHVGDHPCELGQMMQVRADDKMPGYFDVRVQRKRYRMFPVLSRTGAIRLEDRKGEALLLQLSNKSMFIDQKAGRRLADECMSTAQAEVASALKTNPQPGLLDAPAAAPAAAPAQAGPAGAAQDTPRKAD